MIGMIKEGPLRDAALTVAGNQVEHYEMAAYGSLRNFARLLENQRCVQTLQQTLEEEKKADVKLTEIGASQVNKQVPNCTAEAVGSY